MRPIDLEKLKKCFDYDPETGLFVRKFIKHKGAKLGSVAGCVRDDGYVVIGIEGTLYLAHRLAWAYVYGETGDFCLDHINRNRSDNRISNLRKATISQNGYNMGRRKHNTSGVSNVSWDKRIEKWVASIKINRKKVHLGSFKNKEDAILAYDEYAKLHHGEFYPGLQAKAAIESLPLIEGEK